MAGSALAAAHDRLPVRLDADARRLALALRLVPYSDHKGHLNLGWTVVMAALVLLAGAASLYLVYVLEILKFRRLDAIRLRRLRPEASPAEIESDVTRDLETGEFQTVSPAQDAMLPKPDSRTDGGYGSSSEPASGSRMSRA
jgi:hypothetical protein